MTRICLLLIGVVALWSFNSPMIASQTVNHGQELVFRVLLDGKPIGMHRFQFDVQDGRETVIISADFKVTFLAIPVYSYEHRNRELWSNGCLQAIEAYTDDNGDESYVKGQRNGIVFEVVTHHETMALQSDCVMSFAYWDRRILHQEKLLNAQTGDYLRVDIEDSGNEQLRLEQMEIAARRFNLTNEDKGIDISLWYSAESGRWLSLESRVDGRVIRYLPMGYRPALSGSFIGNGE